MNIATQQLMKRMEADIAEWKLRAESLEQSREFLLREVGELIARVGGLERAPAIESDIPSRPVLSLKRG